ncbi:MAG TPA: 50S ribosomal protein L9 [Bryobacteraceae bacterium]|nr:50S ribosomal protein L9 [Bryobacterales bacterium]HRJ21116.1 50S ribosomal protein L9 [Bryobacteraceae bacterium]
MEVILRDDIDKLGNRGDLVKVADGYARNFLLPRRLAVPATEANKKIVEQERQAALRREAKEIGSAQELAALLAKLSLTTEQKAGEQDQLFGSVTNADIASLLDKAGFTIDRRKIVLDAPIKTLGEHQVPVKLHREVTAMVKLTVTREGGEPEPAAEPAAETPAETPAE